MALGTFYGPAYQGPGKSLAPVTGDGVHGKEGGGMGAFTVSCEVQIAAGHGDLVDYTGEANALGPANLQVERKDCHALSITHDKVPPSRATIIPTLL